MKRMTRRHSLSLLAGSAAAAYSLNASAGVEPPTAPTETSWASFRNGPSQRGISKAKLPANPKVKWEIKSKDGWVATCAIVGDHVYAPALQGYLHCFDKNSGKELWKYRSIESKDEKKFAPGFKAAPLVTDQHVFVGDEDGILHAVNRTNGSLAWKFATGAEIAGGVASYEDNVLLASHDAFLYCLSKEGQEVWKFQTNDRINCSPGVVDGFTFVSGCDEHLRVISLTDAKETLDVPMESYMIASPAIVDDMLYVGSHAGEVCGVNWKTGDIEWRYRGDRDLPYHASAAVTDQLVLVGGHDKVMHAIDRKTGEGKWTYATKARIESSPAVVDDRVFFGSGDGNIYGLNVASGEEVWKFNAGKPINAGIAIGEGCMVIGEDDTNGTLRCFG